MTYESKTDEQWLQLDSQGGDAKWIPGLGSYNSPACEYRSQIDPAVPLSVTAVASRLAYLTRDAAFEERGGAFKERGAALVSPRSRIDLRG
jgi:hypothetical protein